MAKQAKENLNVEVYLENVRCSHPHVFVPTVFQRKGKPDPNSKPRYTCGFILDKKEHKKLIQQIEDAIADVKDAKWGDPDMRIKDDNICLVDGDDTDKEELQGKFLLKSAAPKKNPPAVLGRDKRPLREEDGKPYGGCYVNAIVRIFAYDEYDDQVLASLEAVQYFAKGQAFGKGPADTSKFGEYDDEDDEEYSDMRSERGRGRDRDEDEDRGSRRSSRRDKDEDEDRGSRRASSSRRGRDADEDEDRGSRRASSSRRDADEDDDRGSRRSSSRRDADEDDDRGSRRSSRRDRDED